MVKITVFDPALCCSTGVCGAEVDPILVRFAADLEWLRARGVEVRRFNLAQEAAVFAQSPIVRRRLQDEGPGCLPLLLVEAEVVSSGRYPDRHELAAWSGLDAAAEDDSSRPSRDVEEGDAKCSLPALTVLHGTQRQDDASTRCC